MTVSITRKYFLKSAGKAAIALSLLALPFKKIYAGLTVRKSRIDGVYEQDKRMPLRKSQDNPMIKQIYKDFLEHPNSHKAHELLHTEYIDRSAGLEKLRNAGIKI
ncbi:MAG TPA: iron hydrogenase small subunit [Spirochaetota bacterium]|nr:iron hydrogenase small subunit [Spirochaetota bacterium]HPJ33572.1 iron hydrogenase small subunit [Spirochaetota bacterium]